MSMDGTWQDLYRAALVELQPDELRERIAAAETGILQRILELKNAGSPSESELRELDDALRALRSVASSELKQRNSASSTLGPD